MITGRHQILFQPSPVLVFPLVRRLHAGRPRPEARVAGARVLVLQQRKIFTLTRKIFVADHLDLLTCSRGSERP